MAGSCDARFTPVREALAENLALRGELGAAVAVALDGRMVVDLWCGWADAARTTPWRSDTLVNVFSVGKAFAGLCVLMLVSRGQLELDEPVARRWPRFAAAGKERVTVRELLGHRAGLAAIEPQLPPEALYDWLEVTEALAAQRPWWPPGAGHGYHVHTFGFLAGELVRRVSGSSIGAFLQQEIARPLEAQLSFGLAPALRARRAQYVFDGALRARHAGERSRAGTAASVPRTPRDQHLYERAYMNPPGATGVGTVNTPAWMDAELPSANLHADARSVARVYAALLGTEHPLLDPAILAQARSQESAGEDLVLGRPSRFGLGFQLTQPERPLGPNPRSFGHFGAGGSLGFADPDAGVAFAYVMNRGGPQWRDPRNGALVEAVYAALG
ncbi:MAG TPA: serine hydrolase domain-containing protein [Solirubrobacteraceae bacterium]|nr:serine hydrolase domain-containing protein [Solirubrobacteraceae bacterium]